MCTKPNDYRMDGSDTNHPSFHDNITTLDQISKIMDQHGNKEGAYIIRKSFREPDKLVISIKHNTGLVHIRIDHKNGKFALGGRTFGSLRELLDYYSKNPITNEERITDVMLKIPILKKSPEEDIPKMPQARPQPPLPPRQVNRIETKLPQDSNPAQTTFQHCFSGYLTPSYILNSSNNASGAVIRVNSSMPASSTSRYSQDLYMCSEALCGSSNLSKIQPSRMELPGGWSAFVSPGKSVEFVPPNRTAPASNLPLEIWSQLTPEQHEKVASLIRRHTVPASDQYLDMRTKITNGK